MDTVINDFVQVLRRHQVRVSPAESLDALRALEQTGLGERGVVRDTLRTTLVKNLDDIETFDRLFDLYFSLRPTAEKRRAPDRDRTGDGGLIAMIGRSAPRARIMIWVVAAAWFAIGACDRSREHPDPTKLPTAPARAPERVAASQSSSLLPGRMGRTRP